MNDAMDQKLRAALRAAEPGDQFVALLGQRLAETAAITPTHQRTPRLAWGLATGALIVLLGIFFIAGPDRVVSAVARLFGFVPQTGFVKNPATTRLLTSPVMQERNGVRLEIQQVSADDQRTVLLFEISNISQEWQITQAEAHSFVAEWEPSLRLPDGSLLQRLEGQYTTQELQGGVVHLSGRFDFPPLPAGTLQAALVWPRLPGVRAAAGPENWLIDFSLQPGELSGQMVEAQALQMQSATLHGITLSLQRIAYTADRTSLAVAVDWDAPPTISWGMDPSGSEPLLLKDDLGRILPLILEEEDGHSQMEGHNQQVNRYTTARLDAKRTYTLILNSAMAEYPGEQPFTFDPGPNPHIGQEWALDETLEAHGYTVHITGARAMQREDSSEPGIEFEIQPGDEVQAAVLNADGASGAQWQWRQGTPATTSTLFFPSLPTSPLEVRLERLFVRLEGPWQVSWKPFMPTDLPALPASTPVTPAEEKEPTPIQPSGNAEVDRAIALATSFDARFANYTGWVKYLESQENPNQDSVLPDGTPFPKRSTTEVWFYLENGWDTQGVTLCKTDAGIVWQSAAWKNGWTYNFTYNESNSQPASQLVLNFGFPDRLRRALQQGAQINVQETTRNGVAALEIKIAWPDDAYTRDFIEWYWLDLQSGQVIELSEISLGRPQSGVIIQPIEFLPQAPAEIMQILDSLVMP